MRSIFPTSEKLSRNWLFKEGTYYKTMFINLNKFPENLSTSEGLPDECFQSLHRTFFFPFNLSNIRCWWDNIVMKCNIRALVMESNDENERNEAFLWECLQCRNIDQKEASFLALILLWPATGQKPLIPLLVFYYSKQLY